MIAADILAWWYTVACKQALKQTLIRVNRVLDAFSVSLLARTLFAPFRQIDAGRVRGSLEVQLAAWFNRMFSRIVGFFVRSIMIISGYVAACGVLLVGSLWALLWLVLPLLPIAGVVLMILGWTG